MIIVLTGVKQPVFKNIFVYMFQILRVEICFGYRVAV